MTHWRDRTVLVTGSTAGIGFAAATEFLSQGATVVIHGPTDDEVAGALTRLRDTVPRDSGGASVGIAADLRVPDAARELVDRSFDRTGRLDVLVNNAGINVFRGTMETTLDDWDEAIAVDLRAPWLCAKAAAPLMSRPGAIVNVSSNHATSTMSGIFPYNVAKAGVEALTQSLAIELAHMGIRVNAVRPGYVDTRVNEEYFASMPDVGRARVDAERLHLTGRLGTAVEVAKAIAFLASEDSSGFTTGTVLTLDGGRSALLQDPS